jgi:hypothetical protein
MVIVTHDSTVPAVAVGMSVHMFCPRTRILPAKLLQQLPEEIVRIRLYVCYHEIL